MSLPKLHASQPRALERFLPARHRGLPTGIPALDQLLPHGLPRGRITVLDAPLGSGGTALLLTLTAATLGADDGVAFVDAARTLAPQAAAHLAALGRFWVIRPRGTASAWWCADVLLRTGAFGLVVVDQAPLAPRPVAVRLQRLAADKDAVLLVRDTGRRPAGIRLADPLANYRAAIRLAVRADPGGFIPGAPGGPAWPGSRAVAVTVEKGGAPRAAEVQVGIALPHRLRPHWAVRDRRAGRAGPGGISGRGQRARAATPRWPEPDAG